MTNENLGNNDAQQQQNQVFFVNSQYLKDLSFENVTPPSQITSDKQPEIDAQIKVEVNDTEKAQNLYTISLIINISAKVGNQTMFILDANYEAKFTVSGFPNELLPLMLYIECPRQIFPYARHIVSSAVAEGGFPPLYLAPVNFAELYQQQMEAKGQTLQ